MTDRDAEFAGKLVRHLDRGIAQLKPGIAYRLKEARACAMAALSGQAADRSVFALAEAGGRGYRGGHGHWRGAVRWLAAALLVAGIGLGWQQWYAAEQVQEYADIDSQILASDLPIDAYLDRGFQNWLKTSFEH